MPQHPQLQPARDLLQQAATDEPVRRPMVPTWPAPPVTHPQEFSFHQPWATAHPLGLWQPQEPLAQMLPMSWPRDSVSSRNSLPFSYDEPTGFISPTVTGGPISGLAQPAFESFPPQPPLLLRFRPPLFCEPLSGGTTQPWRAARFPFQSMPHPTRYEGVEPVVGVQGAAPVGDGAAAAPACEHDSRVSVTAPVPTQKRRPRRKRYSFRPPYKYVPAPAVDAVPSTLCILLYLCCCPAADRPDLDSF